MVTAVTESKKSNTTTSLQDTSAKYMLDILSADLSNPKSKFKVQIQFDYWVFRPPAGKVSQKKERAQKQS